MGDREPRRDRPDRQPGSNLGKRGPFDQGAGRGANGGLHFRMLVQLKKAGSVIGKGGDFIQMTKSMTGAKVGVDKPVGQADERLVHIEGADEPGKPIAGIQEALLRTAERIMGEESAGGQVKLPHKCQLRMLLFKYQIGAVMGKKGVTINEIRNKSGASVKLTTPQGGGVIVPCAEQDDELITIVGTPEATLTALKLISDKLRAVVSHGQDRTATDRPDNKRSRPDDRRQEPVGLPPQRWDGPGPLPPGHPGLAAPPPGAPPQGNAIAMALPPAARGVLANNDSVKTEGLAGPFTVEYKVLVPVRKSGVILGGKGGVIKEIRSRTGAKVHFFDEEKGAQERILQVMSTEDVQDHHCAAFDATMDSVHALVQDEKEPTATVRIILPHGQVGAVMGKAGSTIKELRNVSGCQIQLIGQPDVPKCLRKGEEVLEMRGPRDSVLLATHIALVAIRGNMARGQLIYNYPPPTGAPPPTLRGPPLMGAPTPHMGGPPPGVPPPGYGVPPPGYGAPPPGAPPPGAPPAAALPPYAGGPPPDPRLQPPQPGVPPMHNAPPPVPRGRSRWDSDAPLAGQQPPLPHAQPQQLSGPPPVYAESQAPAPQYAPAPPQQVPPQQLQPVQQQVQSAPAPPQPQVQYVQGPPPSAGVQVVYSSAPPPAGYVPAPQQQVVYTGPDGQTYVQQQQQPAAQQQQPPLPQQPVQVVQQQASAATSQPMVVYTSPDGQTQYMQQHPPQQVVQQPQQQQPAAAAPAQPPVTYVYAPAPAAAPAAATAVANASGPASASGYGGLTGLVTAAAPAPVAAAPPPVPKARVLLTQDQVVRLRLEDKNQCVQLGALSGAVITLSDHVLENGAREVLLAGTDAQCNTAKNLMEALMRSG